MRCEVGKHSQRPPGWVREAGGLGQRECWRPEPCGLGVILVTFIGPTLDLSLITWYM